MLVKSYQCDLEDKFCFLFVMYVRSSFKDSPARKIIPKLSSLASQECSNFLLSILVKQAFAIAVLNLIVRYILSVFMLNSKIV